MRCYGSRKMREENNTSFAEGKTLLDNRQGIKRTADFGQSSFFQFGSLPLIRLTEYSVYKLLKEMQGGKR